MDMVHSGAFVCTVFKCKDRFLCVSNHRKLLNVLGKSIHHHNVYFTIFDKMGYTSGGSTGGAKGAIAPPPDGRQPPKKLSIISLM